VKRRPWREVARERETWASIGVAALLLGSLFLAMGVIGLAMHFARPSVSWLLAIPGLIMVVVGLVLMRDRPS
jgi:uncharacterized membrane protein HdeD (DUF308 family)